MYERNEKYIQNFLLENLKGTGQLRDVGTDGYEGVDWFQVT
jgi:hypothetical protein